ncbi:hypothetical protein M3Y94_00870300 [Aphelenchoides besseyi]|nr:hypothetical protein M3Y94_00870300 [Aphelenchoides besseyi]KAI6226654.1 hypothetical protein M3Y95_00643400 [Aphelenchoides besseyi]
MIHGYLNKIRGLFDSEPMEPHFSKLHDDALVDILLRLPAKEIVRGMLVDKQWYRVVNTHRFWVQKCIFDGYLDDPNITSQFIKLPLSLLIKCIVKRAFNRNLLDDDFTVSPPKLDKRWMKNRMQDHWDNAKFAIESPPVFLNEMRSPELDTNPEPFESCLVSSFQLSRRRIAINLADYGLDKKALNTLKPTIVVTEFFSNRSDCACVYNFNSAVLNSTDFTIIDGQLRGGIKTSERIPQWEPQWWRKVEHKHTNYKNAQYVHVISEGKDGQFWAGNYGTKIAGTSVVVQFEFNCEQDQ